MIQRATTHGFVLGLSLSLAAVSIGCSSSGNEAPREQVEEFEYAVPMDSESPWPKFRRTAMQSGRSPVLPIDTGADLWVFQTGKGIFSTAVIDGDNSVYVGSADRHFYKLTPDGKLDWEVLTGEIIDSSALLDDRGLVYFGSGDGFLRALNRDDGEEAWRFEADDPSDVDEDALIKWYEGNVAMGLNGDLYVPNGNHCTYGIDRDDGTKLWCYHTRDQTWSLPALNPETNRLFMGSNYPLLENFWQLDPADGSKLWKFATLGSVAASPVVTSTDADGLVAVGSFDGFLYGIQQDDPEEPRFAYGARDHIYASPAQAADGTLIQPSADGTVYAINPDDGTLVWAYDTPEPIRSSPAIDGDGNIYVGAGNGTLYVINPDGTLRWSIKLIDDERDDLNSSPALGKERIVISGESGEIFGIPYDYCLRPNLQDERCTRGPGEHIADEGVFLAFTSSFGSLQIEPPSEITANQALTFTLFVREGGNTVLTGLSSDELNVSVTGSEVEVQADVAGDRRYITIIPSAPWVGDEGGTIEVRVQGRYWDELIHRDGLRFFFDESSGGSFDETFSFDVAPRSPTAFPFPVADAPGDDTGIVELSRISAPLPTILPSYNQIGFDSIHYIVGLVEGNDADTEMIAWAVGGTLDAEGNTIVNPQSEVRYPLEFRWDDGVLTMINEKGFTIEFNGFPLPFRFFRVATSLDADGNALHSPWLNAKTICSEITFYGRFLELLGFCNLDTGLLDAVGGSEFQAYEGGTQAAPEGVGTVEIQRTENAIVATLSGSSLQSEQHNFGLLTLDATTGTPIGMNYTERTAKAPETGTVETVSLNLTDVEDVPADLRVYLMVDAYPAALATLADQN